MGASSPTSQNTICPLCRHFFLCKLDMFERNPLYSLSYEQCHQQKSRHRQQKPMTGPSHFPLYAWSDMPYKLNNSTQPPYLDRMAGLSDIHISNSYVWWSCWLFGCFHYVGSDMPDRHHASSNHSQPLLDMPSSSLLSLPLPSFVVIQTPASPPAPSPVLVSVPLPPWSPGTSMKTSFPSEATGNTTRDSDAK